MKATKDSSQPNKSKRITLKELLKFADKKVKIMMIIGSISSLLNGATVPSMAVIFGNIADEFATSTDLLNTASKYCIILLIIGIITLALSYISFSTWMAAGELIGLSYRRELFKTLLGQEINYFDAFNPNKITYEISTICFDIQAGMGDKISSFFYCVSTSLTGFLIGYIKGWQLALVLTSLVPCMALSAGIAISAFHKLESLRTELFSDAAACVEECMNSIRTVTALGGQKREFEKYYQIILRSGGRLSKMMKKPSIVLGFINFFNVITWSLGFYFGSKLIEDGIINDFTGKKWKTGDVFSAFFAISVGTSALGQISPCLNAFAAAKHAAAKAFEYLNRVSQIDIREDKGLKPEKTEGDIEFKDVLFAYPNNPEKIILNKVSFKIKHNQKTALVGESGCGKTTCLQLIERFYDPIEGSITIDGKNMKDYNINWLRSNFGYVGQEPVLFGTTIKMNMRFAKHDATDEEIKAALKRANAAFVQTFPENLETYVGVGGIHLSGGQKQRIAIARAILKNPSILILDEATSALDRKNELEIQRTLDFVSENRTTIVVAQRLATIRNADHIIVFDKGQIIEEGDHDHLMKLKGKYFQLQQDETRNSQEIESLDEHSSPPKSEQGFFASINEVKTEVKVIINKDTKGFFSILLRLLSYSRGYLPFKIAVLGTLISYSLPPTMSIYMSELLNTLSMPFMKNYREEVNRFCLYFLINALVTLFCQMSAIYCFSINAEKLNLQLRSQLYKKLLELPIGWFDLPENKPGALMSKLANDCVHIQRLAGMGTAILLGNFASVISGLIVAFVACWQMALCVLPVFPVLIYSHIRQGNITKGFSAKTDIAYKSSWGIFSETVSSMKTVASCCGESPIYKEFEERLRGPAISAISNGRKSGLMFGVGQCLMFFIYSYAFFLGAVFMDNGIMSYTNMFKSIFSVIFAATSIGQCSQLLPDIGQVLMYARQLFKILDHDPEIKLKTPDQSVKNPLNGYIEFKNVWFKYPTREEYVLKDFSLKIEPNSKVALLGASGCGKSTILSLLLRYYDPEKGEILIDGIDIKKYDLQYLRRSFGVVSQEPTLFNNTIKENIRYGKPKASDEEVRQAAKEANCLKFIEDNEFESPDDPNAFGQGFERMLGPKGSRISGGQKQRIAIARAIIAKPQVLLLDEATSALDSENEKIIQESLDNAMKGKTCVVVTHRIATIRDADQILFFVDGMVAEKGTYSELMKKRGYFYRLEKRFQMN